tara:strand:+ start:1081 stop:1215 length:135 start_codon:yes stop_codon:yes gene_type:complete
MRRKRKINEELSDNDLDKIRTLIRSEIAQIFFDLYRKKSTWSKP